MLNKKAFLTLAAVALMSTIPVCAADTAPLSPGDLTPVIADEAPLTRAELLMRLYEEEGEPESSATQYFTDVDLDAPYAKAVSWAVDEGIAVGYGDGTFGPDDAITREQMAAVLYRHTQSTGGGFEGAWAFRLPYTDLTEISEYSFEAVSYLTMKQVMGDTGDGAFAPDETVSHEDAETIFTQYFTVQETA